MKYFSERDGFVNAECESCKRVLRIKQEQTIPNDTGFSLTPPGGIRCFCGAIHHSIAGTTRDPSSWQGSSSGSKDQPKSPTDLNWFYYDHSKATNGPFTFEEMKRQYHSGTITDDTLVWHTDNKEPMVRLKKSVIAKDIKGAPASGHAKRSLVPWVFLLLIIVAAILFFGNYHIVAGGIGGPKIVGREVFGVSEIIIDINAITKMPWSLAKSRFPLGCRVLQKEGLGLIDSAGYFIWRPPQTISEPKTPSEIDIMIAAKKLVEKKSSAPSTAKHPWSFSDYHVTELGENRYMVSSYVDAQNSFGAMIRTYYTVVIRKSGDEWVLESTYVY